VNCLVRQQEYEQVKIGHGIQEFVAGKLLHVFLDCIETLAKNVNKKSFGK
jgi:hypothetical protein